MESNLGWILSGPVPQGQISKVSMNVASGYTLRVNTSVETNAVNPTRCDDPLIKQVKEFWELERERIRCMINFWRIFIKPMGVTR